MTDPRSIRRSDPRPLSVYDSLPAPTDGLGRLYLWFPDREIRQRAARHLVEHGPRTLDGDGLVLTLKSRETGPLAEALAAVLGSRDGVRLLWVPGDREPDLNDLLRVVPLLRFLAGRHSD